MRVLRVYHGGRDPGHRRRERALVAAGVDVTLVVPSRWPDAGAEAVLSDEPFPVVELPVGRQGDVNRHRWPAREQLAAVVRDVRPDLVDLHEEPFSTAAAQWLAALPEGLPAVAYTAQNVDKRFPPPFAQYERRAQARLSGLYPCSAQAASVARGKGFGGLVAVLPLGHDLPVASAPPSPDRSVVLGLVGRMVPEKGVRDAVEVLARLRGRRPARLLLVGDGPEREPALALARARGVAADVEVVPWQGAEALATTYDRMTVLLVPSTATTTWVEQFGRVIVEAQARGVVVGAYASGAIPEVLDGAGVLVPEGEHAALADAVLALLDDPPRVQECLSRGLDLAHARSWRRVGERQARFYEDALRSGPAARLPRRDARARARAEFGAPATLAGGVARPFALPVLRDDRPWTRTLARGLDRLGV